MKNKVYPPAKTEAESWAQQYIVWFPGLHEASIYLKRIKTKLLVKRNSGFISFFKVLFKFVFLSLTSGMKNMVYIGMKFQTMNQN